jgi:hypothetical protein
MAVRAKFKVQSITRTKGGAGEVQTIHLLPVTSGSEENKAFWAYTPNGRIELGTVNAEAAKQFELDREFYVDFTPSDA